MTVDPAAVCNEQAFRNSLTDSEFWSYVYRQEEPLPFDDDDDWSVHDDTLPDTVCRMCGSVGACGYDPDGQPMIHIEPDDS